jgi:hypothetical protein
MLHVRAAATYRRCLSTEPSVNQPTGLSFFRLLGRPRCRVGRLRGDFRRWPLRRGWLDALSLAHLFPGLLVLGLLASHGRPLFPVIPNTQSGPDWKNYQRLGAEGSDKH